MKTSSKARFKLPFLAAGLVLLSFAVFWPALSAHFVSFDDPVILLNNNAVINFDLKGMLFQKWIVDFVPLTLFTFAVEHALFVFDPFIYHFDNLILHAANAVLVFFLMRRLLPGRLSAAYAVALLFAVHPLHAESVAWVTERKDVLSAFFYLAALVAYLSPKRRWWAVYLLFTLALLAKLMAVTLPAVLVLIDWFQGRDLKKSWREKIPLALMALLFAGFNPLIHRASLNMGAQSWSVWSMPLMVWRQLGFYVLKTLAPFRLSAIYEPDAVDSSTLDWITPSVLLVLVLVYFFIRKTDKRAGLFFLGVWLVTLAPVLGLVPFQRDFLFADRYMYLPGVGLFAALVLMVGDLGRRVPRPLIAAALVAVIGAFSVLSWQRAWAWHDDEALWNDVIAKYPRSKLAHHNWGIELLNRGQTAKAREEFETSLKIDPRYTPALNSLAVVAFNAGDINGARDKYRQTLEYDQRNVVARFGLAKVLERENRFNEAALEYKKAAEVDPTNPNVCYNWGVALYGANRVVEGLDVFRRCLELDPYAPMTHNNYGYGLMATGKVSEAIGEFQEALKLDPSLEAARKNLAAAQSQLQR